MAGLINYLSMEDDIQWHEDEDALLQQQHDAQPDDEPLDAALQPQRDARRDAELLDALLRDAALHEQQPAAQRDAEPLAEADEHK